MNGWTAAALLLGYMVGLYYGVKAERARLRALIAETHTEFVALVEGIAKNIHQDITVEVKDEGGNVIASGTSRRETVNRLH